MLEWTPGNHTCLRFVDVLSACFSHKAGVDGFGGDGFAFGDFGVAAVGMDGRGEEEEER